MSEILYRCGFDRAKCSISDFIVIETLDNIFDYQNFTHGYHWYSNQRLRIGIEKDGKYAVVEFLALFFIELDSDLTCVYPSIIEEINKYFIVNGKIKFSRLDLYCDYYSSLPVTALSVSDYHGTSSVKTAEYKGDNSILETSYLFTQGKSWLLRRYNKSLEIVQNNKLHRYDDWYSSGIVRTEFEFTESLKNLKNRDFESCLSYIIRQLQNFKIKESDILIDSLSHLVFVPYEYKSKKGIYDNTVLKRNIINHLKLLKDDYLSLNGDLDELVSVFYPDFKIQK